LPFSTRIPIEDASQVSEARRLATKMTDGLGFSEVRTGQVAIVVTEIATNILKHAGTGEILLRTADDDGPPQFEVLGLDQGPGMRSVNECLRDGYTTAGSLGQGLGAIQRLTDESDFYSVPGKGTAILARWATTSPAPQSDTRRQACLRAGAVNVCKRGQEVCGDSWGIRQDEEFSVLLVADGLGHGYEASLASQEAVRMLREHHGLPPLSLLNLSHRALRSSRGAAVAVARIDRTRGTVTFAGVGNVMAQIFDGAEASQHLVSMNGTAGHQTGKLREFSYPWPENGMLILHSDGLSIGAGIDSQPRLALHDPSLIAGVLYRDFSRGQDDATVVVAKAA
jgi:anti-sigma regulatory factor (Ser/Thr protein kinase)